MTESREDIRAPKRETDLRKPEACVTLITIKPKSESRELVYALLVVLVSFEGRRSFAILSIGARFQLSQTLFNTTIRNIDSVDFSKKIYCAIDITDLLVGGGQFVTQSLALIFRSSRSIESLIKPLYGKRWHALLYETMSQEVAALQIARGAIARIDQAGGNLELFEGFFKQIHFLISQSEIVVCFVISVVPVRISVTLCRHPVLF